MCSIRSAQPQDQPAIESLIASAFTDSDYGLNGEDQLVRHLVDQGADRGSWVAVTENGDLVGHVLFSETRLETAAGTALGVGLAPLSVRTDFRRKGIGARLVQHALADLDQADNGWSVVLGDPTYYSRFGYQPASELGITHGFDGIPQEPLQIRCLGDRYPPAGQLFYASAFGSQHGRAVE